MSKRSKKKRNKIPKKKRNNKIIKQKLSEKKTRINYKNKI